MTDNVVVVFTKNNARILHNPPDFDSFVDRDDVLVNPAIPPGVPPHLWKKVEHRIEVMTEDERVEREAHIAEFGAFNSVLKEEIRDYNLDAIKDLQEDRQNLQVLKWLLIAMLIGTLVAGALRLLK